MKSFVDEPKDGILKEISCPLRGWYASGNHGSLQLQTLAGPVCFRSERRADVEASLPDMQVKGFSARFSVADHIAAVRDGVLTIYLTEGSTLVGKLPLRVGSSVIASVLNTAAES
jgi:hypothetical protein